MKPTSRSALFVLLKPYFSWVILALTVICAPISAQQPLPAEKAFAMHVMAKNNGKINLQWQIAPEYQIYRESIIVSNATILHWPKPKPYTDSLGHTKSIYTGTLTLQGKLRDNSKKLIYVNFQGCHGKQQCYPPQHLAFDIAHTDQWLAPQEQKTTHDSMVFSLLGFFMAGILLAFTPCVLPLLPVLAGVLFGQQTPSIRHKLWVAGLYVFSMALTYALAGLLAAWLGYSIQSTLQSPLIIISFACVLLGMGILMWMDSPPAWLSWCMTRQHTTNRWYTPILLGSTTLLVASPCTTPAFIAALTYISATGNLALGGLGLFLLGLGMGMPLLVVALLGVQVLPKSGLWLQKSKKI